MPTPRGCILFDWGDTLMRVFKEFSGPMKDWPRVEAVPGALEVLTVLRPDWKLAIATNAQESDEADIRAALQRVDLDVFIDRVYCFMKIGHLKPAPEFFAYILEDLQFEPQRVFMVGDSFQVDVEGANRSGLRAVWFNPHSVIMRQNSMHFTVHALKQLPGILEKFQ